MAKPKNKVGRKVSCAHIPSILAGVTGEYLVAAELSRRGYIASISLRNTRGMDILVTNQEGTHSVTIQVKTSQKEKKSWLLSETSESFVPDNHYYVFVQLGALLERAHFHIVPSSAVAKFTREDHAGWLARPGRSGAGHVDNAMRKFRDPEGRYLEKWEVLGL
jgi:hypothetical protein